jgi:hypothetical protein
MFIIELLGTGRRLFVQGYSNTLASPQQTGEKAKAKQFASEAEANKWAKAYLPAYKFTVIEV